MIVGVLVNRMGITFGNKTLVCDVYRHPKNMEVTYIASAFDKDGNSFDYIWVKQVPVLGAGMDQFIELDENGDFVRMWFK